MKISIVTSLYYSSSYIHEFYRRHILALKQFDAEYEFIFVDDGSPDDSAEQVKKLMTSERHISLLRLSRNFGQTEAMFAALSAATGDWVYAVDCDLEEPPENLAPMLATALNDSSIDVVYGVLSKRAGGIVRGWMGHLFWITLEHLAGVAIPPNQAWQRVMSRRYVDSLLLHKESDTLFAGLMALTGYKQVPYLINKTYKGTSSYSLLRRLILAMNGVISFSSRPAILICLFGLTVTFISLALIALVICLKFLNFNFQAGWISLIASIWCVGGLCLASIGVLGIYIGKIFIQVKLRPKFIVSEILKS